MLRSRGRWGRRSKYTKAVQLQLEGRQGPSHLVCGELRVGIRRRITHDHRDVLQIRLPGLRANGVRRRECDEAPCVDGMYGDRLQHATLPDVLHEVVEIRLDRVRARVAGILVEQRDGQSKRSPVALRAWARRQRGSDARSTALRSPTPATVAGARPPMLDPSTGSTRSS